MVATELPLVLNVPKDMLTIDTTVMVNASGAMETAKLKKMTVKVGCCALT